MPWQRLIVCLTNNKTVPILSEISYVFITWVFLFFHHYTNHIFVDIYSKILIAIYFRSPKFTKKINISAPTLKYTTCNQECFRRYCKSEYQQIDFTAVKYALKQYIKMVGIAFKDQFIKTSLKYV